MHFSSTTCNKLATLFAKEVWVIEVRKRWGTRCIFFSWKNYLFLVLFCVLFLMQFTELFCSSHRWVIFRVEKLRSQFHSEVAILFLCSYQDFFYFLINHPKLDVDDTVRVSHIITTNYFTLRVSVSSVKLSFPPQTCQRLYVGCTAIFNVFLLSCL